MPKPHLMPLTLHDAIAIESLLLAASFQFEIAAGDAERLHLTQSAGHRRKDAAEARNLAHAMRAAIEARVTAPALRLVSIPIGEDR